MITIVVGIVTGILTGVYSSFIISKYSTFAQYRSILIDLTRRIEYGGSNNLLEFVHFCKTEDIAHASLFLLYLGHGKAGDKGMSIFKEVRGVMFKVERKSITSIDEFSHYYEKWQDEAMSLSPRLLTLFSLQKGL